jgi:hypothetical protein
MAHRRRRIKVRQPRGLAKQQRRELRRLNKLQKGSPEMKFGWMAPIFSKMGQTRRWAWSLNPSNQVIVTGTSTVQQPLLMIHKSGGEVLNAARLAVQGKSEKIIGQTVWPVVPADTSVTLTGTTVFGVRVRVSNSVLNFKYGAVNIRVLDGATLRGEVWVQVNQLPLDLILMTIAFANGLASIVPVVNPIVTFLLANNTALVSGDVLYAESLNMRDIGDIPNAEAACAIQDSDEDEDEEGDEDEDVY